MRADSAWGISWGAMAWMAVILLRQSRVLWLLLVLGLGLAGAVVATFGQTLTCVSCLVPVDRATVGDRVGVYWVRDVSTRTCLRVDVVAGTARVDVDAVCVELAR